MRREAFVQKIEEYNALLGERGKAAATRNQNEPWRQFLNLVMARFPVDVQRDHATQLNDHEGAYRLASELGSRYSIADGILENVGATRLVQNDVRPALRAVQTFGFHLAVLDIRQNSTFHDNAVAQLLVGCGGRRR